ncbi:MAG: MBL fold metallo-hydrolase [Magnetospiraceae bacterium]
MRRFIALPVAGDSFLLQTGEKTIMVDGGYGSGTLQRALTKHFPEIQWIDIAVCTHADIDHAGGFKEILERWKNTHTASAPLIRQFWLPGAWQPVVRSVFDDPSRLADQLVSELKEVAEELDKAETEEQIDEHLFDNLLARQQENLASLLRDRERDTEWDPEEDELREFDPDRVSEPAWMIVLRGRVREILEQDPEAQKALESAKRRVRYILKNRRIGEVLGNYWLNLINTVDIIREIARSAIKHNVKVRWFDYGEYAKTGIASGGEPGLLIPINAVEQSQPPSLNLMMCQYVRLTERNEQSLVFYAPSRPDRDYSPSVLFCGDSPLGAGNKYSAAFHLPRYRGPRPLIATAPHHGSQSNAMGYGYVRNAVWHEEIFWVRSGGSKRHPGKAYKTIPSDHRACTKCPPIKGMPRKPVEIVCSDHRYRCRSLIVLCSHRCDC